MDSLDLIMFAIVALGGWNGYRIGLIRQITRLFGAVIAYFASWWLRPYIAPVIRNLHVLPQQRNGFMGLVLGDFSGAIAFGLVFVVTFLLLRYAAGLIDALFSLPVLSTVNRVAGMVAGIALAVIFVYVGTAVLHYVNNPKVQYQLTHSLFTGWLSGHNLSLLQHTQA